MAFVAKKIFLTKGVGKHRERLSSFELALRSAGIAACNIVRVSSIFPPNCKLISRSEGLKHIKPGQVAFTVISENSTREPHRLIAASIGLALPADKSMYGYLSEHHSFGETEEVAGEYAEELAAEMLATTLNVEFDPDLSFDEKKEVYRISNKIVRTMQVTQSAVGDKRGLWTTVLGAAILIGEDDYTILVLQNWPRIPSKHRPVFPATEYFLTWHNFRLFSFEIPYAIQHGPHNQRQCHR